MSFVYIAPLSDGTAFKVGKAIAPSSRLSQLLQYYDFDTNSILIVASFSNKIRARRLELNLTQAQVADLAGVGKRTVERIENSDNATFYTMVRVLRSLDLEYLFSELEIIDPFRKRARPIGTPGRPWTWDEKS